MADFTGLLTGNKAAASPSPGKSNGIDGLLTGTAVGGNYNPNYKAPAPKVAPVPQSGGFFHTLDRIAFHNPVEHAVGGFAKGLAVDTGKAAHTVYSSFAAPYRLSAAELTGNRAAEARANKSVPTPAKLAGSIAQIGSLGVGGGTAKGAELLGKAGLKEALSRAAVTGAKLAPSGAAYNAGSAARQGATFKQGAKSAAIGAGLTFVAGAGGSLLGSAIARARAAKVAAPKSALDSLVEQVNKAQKSSPALQDKSSEIKSTPIEGSKLPGQGSVQKTNIPKSMMPLADHAQNYKTLSGFMRSPKTQDVLATLPKQPTDLAGFFGKVKSLPTKPETSNPITALKGSTATKIGSATSEQGKIIGQQLHQAHDFKAMESNATKLVNEDPISARDMFLNRDLAKDNPDAHAKLGWALFNDTVKRAKTTDELNSAIRPISNELGFSATRAGQALGAFKQLSLGTPDGIVKYAQKVADLKGKPLDKNLLTTLHSIAEKVQGMEDSPQKALIIKAMKELADQKTGLQKKIELGKEIVSSPRAIMASTDLSFGGRQGAVLGSRFPKEWANAQTQSAKFAVSTKAFKQGMEKVANLTDKNNQELMPLFKRMGLDLEAVEGNAEEIFGSRQLAERLPVAGRVVAGSDRAFSGAAALLRSNVAKKIVDNYGGVKAISDKWTTKDIRDLGRVINTMTGRGHGKEGGWFEKAAPALGQTLFSARLWKSRLDMLNPVFYARLSGPARKVALQSATSFATLVSATLAAAAAAGAQVETDPTSSDFGKIKVGNTRIDIMGGLQQNIVLAAREIEGKTKSSTTGAVTKLNNKYGGPTRLSTAYGFIQNKETPTLGTTSRVLGSTAGGIQVTNPWGEVAKLFIPLGVSDIYQAAQSDGVKGALLGSTTELGAGVQTYSAQSTTNWNKNPGKELTQFKRQVSPQTFSQANKDFNNAVNQWYKNNLNSPNYKAIPDDQKNAYITAAKNKIKGQIFNKYNFTYVKQ